MGQLTNQRDALEANLKETVDNIDDLNTKCSSWRDALCDTYNNDTGWWNDASDWLRKEVSTTIDWLDHIMEWAEHFIELLSKMHKLISEAYDSCSEKELASTIKISEYLDKTERRSNLASEWYDIAATLYKNFGKILSGDYTVEAIDELVTYDNQLFKQLGAVAEQFDDNSDHYWVSKK